MKIRVGSRDVQVNNSWKEEGGGGGEAVSFSVDATPDLTGATVATDFDTIGIAVSGASIFNDQEGGGDGE